MKWKHVAILCSCLLFVYNHCFGQVHPPEAGILNYRLIGFSVPPKEKTTYLLEIANGINNNELFFKKNTFLRKNATTSKMVASVPQFGKDYTWRVSYINSKDKVVSQTQLYHFSTGNINYVDTSLYRIKVIDTATAHKDMYVFYDCLRALCDMNGNPVWFLPDLPGEVDTNTSVRDMKISPYGTITFLAGNYAYEVDYDGNITWPIAANGKIDRDTSEYYHHEFLRLPGGHYMVAGHETEERRIPFEFDTLHNKNERIEKRGNHYYVKVKHATIIEYDTGKHIVWKWSSKGYFSDEDLFGRKAFKGVLLPNLHYNAFYFNQQTGFIYASFKNLNRILKIEYPSGLVAASYGQFGNSASEDNSLFYGQHNCRITSQGYLSLFNNNTTMNIVEKKPGKKSTAYVQLMKEPLQPGDTLSLAWQFPCTIDDFAPANASGGGSVYELSNTDLIVSMGTTNRDFIVTREKKIVWNVITEMKKNEVWIELPNYRLSVIDDEQRLHKLLFSHGAK